MPPAPHHRLLPARASRNPDPQIDASAQQSSTSSLQAGVANLEEARARVKQRRTAQRSADADTKQQQTSSSSSGGPPVVAMLGAACLAGVGILFLLYRQFISSKAQSTFVNTTQAVAEVRCGSFSVFVVLHASAIPWHCTLASMQTRAHPIRHSDIETCSHNLHPLMLQGIQKKQLLRDAQVRLNEFSDRLRNTQSVDLSAQVGPHRQTSCVLRRAHVAHCIADAAALFPPSSRGEGETVLSGPRLGGWVPCIWGHPSVMKKVPTPRWSFSAKSPPPGPPSSMNSCVTHSPTHKCTCAYTLLLTNQMRAPPPDCILMFSFVCACLITRVEVCLSSC